MIIRWSQNLSRWLGCSQDLCLRFRLIEHSKGKSLKGHWFNSQQTSQLLRMSCLGIGWTCQSRHLDISVILLVPSCCNNQPLSKTKREKWRLKNFSISLLRQLMASLSISHTVCVSVDLVWNFSETSKSAIRFRSIISFKELADSVPESLVSLQLLEESKQLVTLRSIWLLQLQSGKPSSKEILWELVRALWDH